ncbi:dystonin isoform X12 [Polypterus senegalus]|uniref:dystonin isoform X12 n=1 Tax=Polypterus senegalus TaxID=55291 RepID=UPI0019637923|nr:dystonin isoform X12 [Polypterus senegalus]
MAGHYIPSAYLYAADEQEYLQAYEDVLERYKDERDRVQKKTFTKWINQHLLKVRKHVNDLYEDLRDGHNLISLLEVLSGETLPREKGRMRFHRLQNVQIALDYLKKRQVKLVNIRNDDITDGNPKLTLGLIWTIILHFQISDIHVTGESEDMTAKERLLLWSQQSTDGYVGVRCENFTTCWRDGRLFNAIIHKYRPDLIDMNMVASQCSRINLEQAFNVAEQLGVARLLDPEDVDVQSPDEKSVITYVSTLYDVFPKVLEGSEGINANDVDIKWVEYQNMVNYLSQWIKHHVTVMSDRTYPNSPVELKALYNQYLKFKESEIPLKENEKARIKHLYRLLEPWIEFGRIKLPQGYHPNDVEKEWGKLIIAMLEREKSLRPEVERLEMLQQIANRVQRDCVAGEDKLILARNALQSDAKRLESGIQFQNEAEIAGYLLECETLLRQQVVDIQILLDGKFYLADQLVQRVSKIRDDLFTLKSECSSVYSKGRSLTTEQTKRMISGITQSLNSGFSQSLSPSLPSSLSSSLTPSLMPGLSPGLTSSYTSSLTPSQTPSLTPGITPGLQSPMVPSYLGGMDSGSLQTLKLMQIRKPLLKSSLADPSLTEEEVNMKFVQDLLNWVEEMQLQLDRAEWGSDLQSVESHFENHKNVHGAIEEFQMSLKEAKISEIQMTPPLKHSYSEKLGRLESQYGKLLNTSRNRQKHLDTLHEFVSKATRELIWLNEKEEEEVSYDWSDRSSNLAKKKDYHADLMRILDDKERVIKSVQEMAEQLLLENHPARLTIEAYRAAMQTQWSWVLQLCGCVEQHLKENTLYFEFFSDARESMDYLKNLQETIQRKYSCDRTSSLHKLEDLIQESMDEKEQLLQYRSTVASLVGRAKAIVQLKLRSPDSPIRTSIPVKAICDYRQIEITIYKDDECVLASNSHRAKWKIISPTGNEAMVPSVCFTIPPPNKEAIEYASRIEQLYQNVLALWHQSHINMKSVVSWRYLMNDIEAIRNGKVASIKTMLPGEHQQVLSNLQTHFEDFLDDTEESEIFTVSDRNHLEREVEICKQYYEELLKSAEREEHEESVYNLFISDMRNFRMRLESCEERLIRQIRTPLQRDDLQESALRIAEQEKSKKELDRLKEDLETMKGKCEMFLNQASASPSASTLSSELNLVVQNMNQIYSMSAIYLEKLKTVNLVVKNSQAAEALVKLYEAKLCEEDAVNADAKAIESVMGTLKQWRTEIDEKREVFHDLEDELQKARTVSERMFKTHNERDFDLDWHKEKADQLAERWQSVHSQVESRLRDLEGISKSLRYYKDTYFALNDWIKEMEATQLRMQENQPEDSKALAELLNQQKVLVSEIEVKQSKIDECQKYSEQYSAAVKDYELQLMTYRAMVDSQHKSPVKRRRMQSSSDMIIQEFMDLRTCYTALVTLMTQYIKYASETLKRTEEEEKSVEEEKKEHGEKVNKLLNWVSRVKKEERPLEDGTNEPSYMPQVSMEDVARKKEQISEALRATQMILTKHSDKMTEEEKQETKEQLKSLQQAYNDLSQQPLDQLHQPQSLPAEQEHQVIQGILDLETGAVFSVPLAMQKGLVDCTTGILLLEAQLVTTGLVSPESMKGLDLEEAFQNGLIDQSTYSQLQEIDCANKNLQRYSSDALPVIRAVTEGAISEALAFRIINIHLASGGLKVSRTGEMLSLQTALQNDLIPESLFVRILETEGSGKHLVDPNTAEKLSLAQTVQRSRLHGLLGLRVLDVKKRKDGRISLQSGGDLSIFQAILEGRIDQETAVRLLGAQLFAGGIIDPESSHKLNVEEAIHKGLIDEDMSCAILSYQVQNGGIVDPHGGKRLTLDEAVQCNLMSSRSALLVLERQGSLKGLICPNSGETFTVSSYFEYKEATTELDCKLPENRHQITALYIPDTSKVLNFENAEAQGMLQRTSTLLLKSTALPDSIPNPEEMNENAAKWTLFCNSCVDGHDLSESQLPHLAPVSASEAKRWFISYLMINSYVDPKSGQRVLIYERELDKMTSFYTEKILLPDHDNFQIILSAVPQEPGKEISTLLHQCFNTEVENISVRQSLETTFNNDIGSKQFMDANAFDGKEVVESVDTQGFLGQVQEQHDKVKSETTPDSEVVANIDSQDFMHLSSSMVGSHMNVQNDFLLLDEPMDTTPTNHHQNLNIQEDPHHDLVTEPVMDHNHIFETNLSDSKTDYRMHQNKIAQILTEGCTLPQMAVVEKEEALFASEPNKICNSCELDWTSLRNMNSPHDISESHSCNPITPDMSRSHNGEVDKLTSELSLGRHTDKQEHFLKEQSLHTEAMTIKCLEFDKYSVQSLENQPGPLDECTDEELKLEPYIKKSSFGEQMIIEELSAETREGEVIKDRSREMLTLGDCTQHKHVVVDTSDELNDHQDLTATDNVKSNVKLLSSDDDCMVEKISVSESKRNSDAIEVHAAPEEATVKLQLEEVSAMKYALLESEEEMLGDVQGKSWLKEEEKAELCLEPEKLLCVMEADHRVEMPTLVQVRASHDFQHQLISASIESSVGVLRDTDRAIPHERSDGGEMFDGTREEHWGNCELSIEEQFIEGMSASDMTLSQDCGLPRTTVTISDQPCKSTITDKQIFPNFDITYSVNKTRQTCKRAQTEEHCDPKISQAIRKSHKFDQDSVSSLGLLSEMTRSSNSEPTDIVSNEGQLSLLTKRNKMGIENLPGDPSKNGDDHYLEEDSSTNVLSSFVNSDEEEPTSDPAGTLFLKSSEVYRFGLEDKYSKAVECHDSIPGVLHPLTEMKINARNNYNNLELSENGKSEHLKAFNNSEIETETEYENLEQISGIGESSGNYPYVPNLEPEKTSDDQESDTLDDSIEESQNASPQAVILSGGADVETNELFQANRPQEEPPEMSDLYHTLRSNWQDLMKVKVTDTTVEVLQKAESKVIEGMIKIINNAIQSSGGLEDASDSSDDEDRDDALTCIDSRSPDILIDLLKQSGASTMADTIPEMKKGELFKESPHRVPKSVTPAELLQEQLQRLFHISPRGTDPDLNAQLNEILVGFMQREGPPAVEGVKSGQMAEATDRGTRLCPLIKADAELKEREKHEEGSESSEEILKGKKNGNGKPLSCTQHYLECIGRLQDHSDVLEDLKEDLNSQELIGHTLEILTEQLDSSESLESQLSALSGTLAADLKTAECLLESTGEHVPTQIRRDLEAVCKDLQLAFADICKMAAERRTCIKEATALEKSKIKALKQDLLDRLQRLADFIQDNTKTITSLDIMNTDDLETVKYRIQHNKDLEKALSAKGHELDTTAFDVQYFISEYAQDLLPSDSRDLLRTLSTTQRSFKEIMEMVSTQRDTLMLHLEIRRDLSNQKTLAEKQKEYTEKLEEMCHLLTQTENRIIGHQQTTLNKDSLGDLQQYQTEHQALQRDVQAGQSALAEIVKSSNKFLEENQGKLHPDQVALIESRVDEAKRKSKLLSQRAEESRKELDKALTTAIKQETAKVAAEEQLEDSKNKIKGLLGWLSNIGKDQGVDENLQEQMVKQNGNLPLENRSKLNGQEDDANGNLPQLNGQTCTVTDGKRTGKDDLDLSKQHDRVKAHHREILSQQQAFIIATQSAQALLEKQGHMLSPGEKEKLQSNIQELRDRYETTLTEAELKMKLIQTVQDELQKFRTDCGEFENWLQQSETEIAELKSGVSDQDHLNSKLQRQKSFSDDVISHKGDLRFITISGQRVLDAAKMCNKSDTSKDSELSVDTSGVSTLVQDKLESAANHYKSLHSQCYLLGNNLKDVVEKYKHYGDASSGIVTWLEDAEETARKQLAEVIAVDPQDLQKQLEDTKVLHGQVSGRQGAIEKLRKAADAVIATEGNLLTNCDEIQRSVGDVVERYDNLAKSVSDRNETLQITLTRSLSVQDGLDEMLDWMKNVEKSLEEQEQVPLHSTAIQEALSKEAMLEQDIVSRQSSIAAMKEKVSKFIETADPSTASSLQAKMNTLSKRFTDASQKHREKVHKLEELKDKVDMFEKTAEKVQQFVAKGSRTLTETDGPGKNVNELSQLMQETNAELTDQAKDIEVLQKLSAELADLDPDGSHSHIQKTIETLSRNFKDFEDTVKEKEEEVSSCQGQLQAFKNTVESLQRWLDESTEKLAMVQPSCSVEEHEKSLQTVKALSEEWTAKAPAVEDVNRKGSEVCNLISVLTSPAKTKSSVKAGKAVVNGSGPHGYLTNKELMLVQQHLTYVNQSYDNLGEHLKEKRGELEGALQDLSVVHNEGDSLKQWLTDMQKEVTSWNTGQAGNESVKTQMEQHKSLEVELKVKQGQLQQLKEKLSDLLEKHPQSSEAEKWKQMLDQIDSTWKDVTSSMEERKEKLEESSRNLAQFQTNEEQLKQWLAEKELMLGVLGPLSIDPNMLKAQKQQVQILLKEFDSRKSQYEQLKEAAQSILSQPGDLSPSCTAVKSQLAAITDKWEGVTGQLTDRSDRIDEAIVKTSQFQEVLRNLSEQVNALGQSLGGPSSLSTQPDAVKQQLETAMDVRSKLDQEKTRVAEAEALCKELSALVGEEYLKADLSRQLESILKPFKDLEEKAGNRIEQLNLAFASSQQFNQMSRNFHEWLDGKVQDLSKVPPLSANMEVLHRRIKEHATYQTSLEEQSGPYKKIVQEGEALLQTTQGAERTALQNQLATLQGKWDTLRKQSADYSERAQVCLKQAQKYKEHLEKVQPWIEDCEKQLTQVTVSVDPAEVDCSISRARTLQKDVDKHRGVVELFHNAADSLLEVTQADHEPVKEEKANVTQKVENISEILQQKRDTLDKIAQRLKEFNDTHKEVREHLKGARQQLTVHESLGAQVYSNKHLTNMKAQQKALETLGTQVGSLKGLAQGLVVDASDAAGVSDLLLKVESLDTEFKSVKQQVEDVSSFLETKLQGIGQFQNSIREMFSQFSDLDDELDSMQPVGRDLDVLRLQKEDMRNFIKKLQELIDNTATANKNCQQMLEKEGSPDLPGLKRDLEALNKQCGKLMDRAKGRQDQVEAIYSRVDEFYQKLKELSEKCIVVEEHEESQGAVRMEIEIVNQQLDAFKVFQKEEIEPLQGKLQDVNWIGQGLIQSAAKTTNTQKLEQDLEDINMRCNTLNKKVAERAALLHEALLHCGRFQDALESLLSWLTDTEELVANQKPPSAEFKVVKAQIQEQKLLQRLLEDRKPTVDIIKREGEKISASVESPDKEKTLKELVTLGQRWESLLGKAETRHRQLECILVVAQQFHETLEPLTEWLTSMEKRLANTEPIGTQTKKLEEQISQHKALEDDIMAHSKNLHQAISVGQTLKTLSSPDDKDSVQSKVDSAQSQFGELQETSGRKAAMLQQAFSNAQHFGEDEVALMNWLSEVHEKLSNVAVHDYHPDLLQKQDAEQRGLHVDIIQKKQNVDLAIQNGLELLKQTTGDEVLIIQEKLDGIKARYAEINTMSGNVSKLLNQALTLSTRLFQTHEELCQWLGGVEAEVVTFEAQVPVGEQLSQVQERQKDLLKDVKDHKALVSSLNEVSSSLLELVPWRAREGLDKLVSEDNERYKLVSDALVHHVEEIDATILRSQQFEQAADVEFAWLSDMETKLLSQGDIRLEQDQTTSQLQAQKAFSMDILRHKDNIDEILKKGEAMLDNSDEEEKASLKEKIRQLLEKYDVVSHINSERCLQLERAHSLASQFWETYDELWPWLQDIISVISQLPAPAIEYETLKQQQEELRQMRELIAEHKPHIDKMNKTGPQLLQLSPTEGLSIQEKYTASDQLYAQIKENVKQRAAALDEAMSKSTQLNEFHDKIDPMLETLKRIVERLRTPPSISVEVEKIKEQINENKNVLVDLEKLQPVFETLKQRGQEMIARSEGADKDVSAKAVQEKLDLMVFIWEDIHALLEERETKLLDVMDLAEKFWCDHSGLIATIKDTQDLLRELEEPGVDPSVVKQQQETAESFGEEIEGLQEELDAIQNLGDELMSACGEPDKPVIKKSIDELNTAFDNLNKNWKERMERLEEAMQSAVQFQDGLQGMFDWVDILEGKIDSMSPVGTDLETVKQQIVELKEFKAEAYQLQIEMEKLNHQAELLLKKVVEEDDKHAIQDPFTELKLLWDNLDEKIVNRQHKLEDALLALGQFQHALDELLTWMTHTEELLNEQKKTTGDPKAIEIELAKHHVLQNDVLAHKTTVEAVNIAGNDLIESSAGEEASNLQNKLESLKQRWEKILEKTEQRRQQLDSALLQAQGFHGEIEDMQHWLKETERQLLASKGVGGLPETAREQLNVHLELCGVFELKEELYKKLMAKGEQLIAICPESHDSNTQQDLLNLREKWESVQAKMTERKVKLEEALTLATEFHNSLQDFINWLTQAEQTLTMATSPSLIMDTILFQIDEHKVFVTEVNSHRDQIIELDKTGTHLKYFSQKQDVVLIKNLLISVQSRWEKVVQRSVERGRTLDDARKRAKQFSEAWNKLMEWLEESEKALDSELEIANDPDKIKLQLAQHKEFQKALGAKHSMYDTTLRSGRSLKEKTSLNDDNQKLDDMLSELRDKWDTVCGKSVERCVERFVIQAEVIHSKSCK